MSKRLIYVLIAFLGVIAIVLTLFWTLFAVSSVSVEFSSTLQNLNVSEEEIVEAADVNYGACVLFDGKSKYIENIYNASSENENLAYVRVVNIETVFPNKYVIHVSEREELYAIENGENYLICDRDLRVLRVTTDIAEDEIISLSGLNILNEEIAIGDFLSVQEDGILNLYSSFLANNRSLSEICGKFESMVASQYQDELGKTYDKLTMTTYSGRIFEVCNLDFALSEKIALMFSFESSIFSNSVDSNGNFLNSSGSIIYVSCTSAGELVSSSEGAEGAEALTLSLVANCMIRVDNLTLSEYVERTTSDIYCSLVLLS